MAKRKYHLMFSMGTVKPYNDEVKLRGAYFCVMTPDPDNTQKVKDLLDAWYKEHARIIFLRRLEECYIRAKAPRN